LAADSQGGGRRRAARCGHRSARSRRQPPPAGRERRAPQRRAGGRRAPAPGGPHHPRRRGALRRQASAWRADRHGQGRPGGREGSAPARRPDPRRGRVDLHRLRHAARGGRGGPGRRRPPAPRAPGGDRRGSRCRVSALAHSVTTRPDEYELFCDGFRALTQIDLSQYKRGQMERRIRSFAQRRGVNDLRAYLGQLRSDAKLLDEFLDRVTINVSQLWRNPEQWTMLARDVLKELADSGRIRAWSAGCSYGAEAYTLAALCQEVAPDVRVDIRGTDIDR